MSKRYFSSKKKEDPRLSKIIALLVLLVAFAYGGLQGYQYWRHHGSDAQAPSSDAWTQLEQAQAHLEAGEWAAAEGILSTLSQSEDASLAPKVRYAQARLALGREENEEALSLLKSALETWPESPDYPAIATEYAKLLDELNRHEESSAVFEALQASAPPAMAAAAAVGLGQKSEREGDLEKARDLYLEALYAAPPNSNDWNEALDALGALNINTIFSPAETPASKYYTVESGDNLTDIGIKLNTTQGLLIRANALTDPSRLRLGQRLKYTPKDFQIIIERSTCRLFLVDNEGIFKRYYTGLGMPGHETALGRYTIGNKQKDPTWFQPGGGPIPPGDPKNELGTRWMPLVPAEEGLPNDLGIHGTIHPETIGQYKSHGCPRMRKEDVEELYDLVVRSTHVNIVDKIDWAGFQTRKTLDL